MYICFYIFPLYPYPMKRHHRSIRSQRVPIRLKRGLWQRPCAPCGHGSGAMSFIFRQTQSVIFRSYKYFSIWWHITLSFGSLWYTVFLRIKRQQIEWWTFCISKKHYKWIQQTTCPAVLRPPYTRLWPPIWAPMTCSFSKATDGRERCAELGSLANLNVLVPGENGIFLVFWDSFGHFCILMQLETRELSKSADFQHTRCTGKPFSTWIFHRSTSFRSRLGNGGRDFVVLDGLGWCDHHLRSRRVQGISSYIQTFLGVRSFGEPDLMTWSRGRPLKSQDLDGK